VIFSFARSNSFTGIISDGFHNRYDVHMHREFNARFHLSATASYVQQQASEARNTNGELFSVESRYFFSRNLAAFSQARYLNITGNQRIIRPEKSLTIGIRWAWVPEKP
jgi:predicted porin